MNFAASCLLVNVFFDVTVFTSPHSLEFKVLP